MEPASLILDEEHIEQKIKRIAYQIMEDHCDENQIIVVGICEVGEGFTLAKKIAALLREIDPEIETQLTSINLDKKAPDSRDIEFGLKEEDVKGKVVILVDDVANSGRTLIYALQPILMFHPKIVKVAVLVDRRHKRFPIAADYVGLSLATTIHEHIDVNLGETKGVYLS